ncbi:MAG TPA: hypothetical protein VJR89_40790, partial [Polyangiales bacterium]|nr:hypothetical protein [Polyangiales bacterium]
MSRLDPPLVQPGDPLELSGRHFPNLAGTLSLRGELRSAGSESRSVSVSLPAEVVSPELVRVPMTAEVSQLVRDHSLFRGSAVLRFTLADGSHSVAKLPATSIEWAGQGA